MPARTPVVALLLGAWAAACGQDPAPVEPVSQPARLVPVVPGDVTVAPTPPTAPPVTELPPFLAVPPPVVASPPRRPCHACPNDYHPCHVYLPEQNPDWGAGSCDGECGPCRLNWCSADFLCLKTKPLGDVDRKTAYGLRFGAGHWFGPDRTLGVEASFLNVHDTYHEFEAGPSIVNSPLTVTAFDLNGRLEVMSFERWRFDGLAGYRYVSVHEKLFVGNANFVADLSDRNTIHAAQVGAVATYKYGAYFHEMFAKVGLGSDSETVTTNGVPVTDSVMTGLGELGIRCGYQIGEGCWFTAGFDVLYLTSVARPGRGETDFYLYGFSVGFEKRF
jgi:Putative beta barrel porin-7 (BBP7)